MSRPISAYRTTIFALPRVRAWATGLLAAAVWSLVVPTEAWQGFEERAIGLVLQNRGPKPWNPAVHVLAIDDETYARLGRPLLRMKMVRLVQALHAAGAGVIAFDMVYDSPAWDGPDVDRAFSEALTRHGRVILPVDCLSDDGNTPLAPVPLRDDWQIPPVRTPAAVCGSIVQPLPELRSAGRSSHFLLAPSSSGYGRSVMLFADAGGVRLPGLALAAYAEATGASLTSLVQEKDRLRLGTLDIPVSPGGGVVTSFRAVAADSVLSIAPLVESLGESEPARLPPDLSSWVNGKHFIVAVTAQSNGDKGLDVGGRRVPHTLLHAAVLSDLLEGKPVRDLALPHQLLVTLLVGALTALTTVPLSTTRSVLAFFTAVVSVFAAASWFSDRGVLFGPLAPSGAALAAWAATTATRLSMRDQERRVLSDAFGAYVDPEVMKRILQEPDQYLALRGAKRTLTVLFADMSGFTALSNALEADQVIRLVRDYLDSMIGVITAEKGRVDKIMGDGILAVFGDPIPSEDHALRAVRAAMAMQSTMLALHRRWVSEGLPKVGIRVGIATGEVYVGNVGATGKKIEYTVLGTPVNLAARLEARAPVFGTLISEETQRACPSQFELVRFSGFQLKGFSATQSAYLVMGNRETGEPLRRRSRLVADTPVRIFTASGAALGGTVENVSLTGVYVRSEFEAQLDDRIELELLGPREEALRIVARVKHLSPADMPRGFGAELVGEAPISARHVLSTVYGSSHRHEDSLAGHEQLSAEPTSETDRKS